MVRDGGVARLVISHLPEAQAVGDAIASSGGQVEVRGERLRTVSTPSRIASAAGRAGGQQLADLIEAAVGFAVDAWLEPSPPIDTPLGLLDASAGPLVMGVLNTTPDSFSDGGVYFDPAGGPDRAVEHANALLDAGADLIDVGGESTRPGADPVPEGEELGRVLPVIEALAADRVVVSVDTSKANVARAAVAAGAVIVNDVSAGALDGLMLPTVAELGVPYIAMHMRGTPRTMQRDPEYDDVVGEVFDFLAETVERAAHLGVPREHVIVDPGIGFGKTVAHNLALLRHVRDLTSLGRPVLIGTSRKSFIGRITGVDEPAERLVGSVVTAAHAATNGAAFVRVHDVAETVRAVRIASAIASGDWRDGA